MVGREGNLGGGRYTGGTEQSWWDGAGPGTYTGCGLETYPPDETYEGPDR